MKSNFIILSLENDKPLRNIVLDHIIKTEKLYNDYCDLMNEYFSYYDLDVLIENKLIRINHNKNKFHYIVRKEFLEKDIFIAKVGYYKKIEIARIISEPEFARVHLGIRTLRYHGLEIKIFDKEYKNVIIKFCKGYEKMFNKSYKIIEDEKLIISH